MLSLQDLHEVAQQHHAVALHVRLLDHVPQLVTGHVLAELVGNALEIFEGNVVLLLGEEDEGFLQLRLSVPLRHLRRHYVQEVIVVNGDHAFFVLVVVSVLLVVGQLGDEALDLLLGGLEAEGTQGHAQILQRDVPIRICVEQLESFLNVGLLLLSQLLAELAPGLLAGRA